MNHRRGEGIDPAAPSIGNPYLDAYWRRREDVSAPGQTELLPRFGFAVPDERALRLIADHSPCGALELGAGTGYWARLLHERGVDVIAHDIAPPPSSESRWFAGQQPWFPVQEGDERVVTAYPERTLLLVWPTRNEDWAADAAQLHLSNGGKRLAYVGESPGGRTGDLRLHAVLDLVGRCVACAYGIDSVPCTCGVTSRWRLLDQVPLPSWNDSDDQLYVFGPPDEPTQKSRWTLDRWRPTRSLRTQRWR